MDISQLKNQLVAVLGFGVEGRAISRYLLKHGIAPVLFDQKPWEQWTKEEQAEIKRLGVSFIFGQDAFLELKGFDVAFRSPGIPLRKLRITDKKLTVTSQTKFFFDNCPAKIIGVTGTKGKGTTCALVYEILRAWGGKEIKSRVYLTGNIGAEQPLDIIDALKTDDWIVYELSSFQLQDLTRSPHVAVVLMMTVEHLDYHTDIKEYLDAKAAITKFQRTDDTVIINADYPASVTIGQCGSGQKIYFSRLRELTKGCFVTDRRIIAKNIGKRDFQLPLSLIQLRGEHNLENICAAVTAACVLNIEPTAIRQAVESFKGLEHRLEFVTERRGVKFYNDSFSTTPETAIAAIKSFSEPLIVILGGSSKNSDFNELGKTIAESKNIKSLILIGEEAPRILNGVRSHGGTKSKIYTSAQNISQIFEQIRLIASAGDVVLLSPACASFGLFKNYKDRGEQFKNYARNF